MQFCGHSESILPTQIQAALVCFSAKSPHFGSVPPLCSLILLVSLVLGFSFGIRAGVPRLPFDEGIRIDLPSNGQLRVENQFGDINITVGKERDVSVSAKLETLESGNAVEASGEGVPIANLQNQSGELFKRSPVVIETKKDLLSISVIRPPGDLHMRLNLTLTIPANTHAEIIAGAGTIVSRGLPLSMSLNTIAGPIQAQLETPLDADIIARSSGGIVRSEIGSPASGDAHDYHSRFGSGQKVLRLNSQRGDIILSPPFVNNSEALTEQKAPELRPTARVAPGAGTPATQSATEEVDEGDVIRVDAQLVTLNLSVVDRGTNRGLAGLSQSDFKLFENGVEQRLLQFDSSSAPFDLVLVIDLSGSTRDVVKLIRAAARRFVDAARPSDRIAIITFAGRPTVVSSLTLDREALRQRVNAIDTVSGDTKLYDASDFAMAEVVKETKNSRRAAIVLMSDGLDGSIPGVQGEGSKLSYQELLNGIREFDGVLYTLWLNTYYEALNPQDTQPEAFDAGHDRMKEMADAGGGLFYEVEGLEDLAGAYERVVADLGTVYSLAYRPSNKGRDGKWRAIQVTVARSNAVARGKHGYYAN
jgi:VWFA-related protein